MLVSTSTQRNKTAVLFGGTKVLQSSPGEPACTPDGGCLAVVLCTGFGTALGQLVRTMPFSAVRVSANNLESFLFIEPSHFRYRRKLVCMGERD